MFIIIVSFIIIFTIITFFLIPLVLFFHTHYFVSLLRNFIPLLVLLASPFLFSRAVLFSQSVDHGVVVIDTVAVPGIPATRWVYATRPVFLSMDPSKLGLTELQQP